MSGHWITTATKIFTELSTTESDLYFLHPKLLLIPFEEISEQSFESLEKQLSEIDLSQVFEPDDTTDLHAEAACAGGSCAIV